MRKNIQHIKLEAGSQKLEVSNKETFHTAENIELKPLYSEEDVAA